MQDASKSGVNTGRWRAFSNLALIVPFLGLLWAPITGQLTGVQSAEGLTENRTAAPLPTLEWTTVGPLPWPRKQSLLQLPDRFEAYYNDHFGFRRPLIRCYNLAVLSGWMPASTASSAGKPRPEAPALVGRNGWLFCTRDEDMETYRCARPYTKNELANWTQVLRDREAWLAARGIRYVLVTPPSKPTVYPEYLPRAIKKVNPVGRIDQLAGALKTSHDEELLIDLTPGVLASKHAHPEYPCFYRTDTHWNFLGGYYGYRSLMQGLQRWYPAAQPRELKEFQVQMVEGPPLVLAEMMDTAELFTDTHVVLSPKHERHARIVAEAPATKDGIATSVCECPGAPLGHAVVLHDSFMMNMQPFFNEHWRQVHYFWTRNFPYDKIDALRPDIVIQEMVEQVLTMHTPSNPSGMEIPADRAQWAQRPTAPRK